MPELPEVEVTRRSFADAITGASVQQVSLGKPLRWPLGCAPETLAGRRVTDVRRRGKYLLLELDGGAGGLLLIHLGMSGSLRFAPELPPPGKHDHFDLTTERGTLRLHDPRRFGAVVWVTGLDDERARKLLDGLGMEPLDEAQFDLAAFHAGLRASRAPIKQLLLAGRLVWAWATSMPARCCTWPASGPLQQPAASARCAPGGCTRPSARCWSAPWSAAARRCATLPAPTAALGTSRPKLASMAARASPARAAASRCRCCARASAAPFSADAVSETEVSRPVLYWPPTSGSPEPASPRAPAGTPPDPYLQRKPSGTFLQRTV